MLSPYPAAVLWDMDGTLVDTEPLWISSERALVERHGGTWTDEDSKALVGSDLLAAGDYIRRRGALPLTAAEVVEHLLSEVLEEVKKGATWRPGAPELLAELRSLNIPCGLVTMSYRVLAEAVITQLPAATFATVVTGDVVSRGKPHPEPYLTAAAELGVPPADCVVIEDSPTGAASGVAAGMRVLGVPNTVSVEPQDGMVVIESLMGIGAAGLLGAFNGTNSS